MATALLKNLQSRILDELQPALATYGFNPALKKGIFARVRGECIDRFWLQYLDAKPGCRVEPGMAIRIGLVEEIFHVTSGIDRKYQNGSATIACMLRDFPKRRLFSPPEYLVETDSEIPRLMAKVLSEFRDRALPYFDRFGSLGAIDHELNSDPCSKTAQCSLAWYRCSTGLIVARLIGRDNYEELANQYIEIMRQDNKGFYFRFFRALIESLKSVSPLSSEQIENLTTVRLPRTSH